MTAMEWTSSSFHRGVCGIPRPPTKRNVKVMMQSSQAVFSYTGRELIKNARKWNGKPVNCRAPVGVEGLWSYGLCIIVRNIKEYNFLKTHIWRPRARSMCLVTLLNRCIKGMHTQSYHVVVTRTSINQSYMFKYNHVNCQLYSTFTKRITGYVFERPSSMGVHWCHQFKRISYARDVCQWYPPNPSFLNTN